MGRVAVLITVKKMHKSKMLSVDISSQYMNTRLFSLSIDKSRPLNLSKRSTLV